MRPRRPGPGAGAVVSAVAWDPRARRVLAAAVRRVRVVLPGLVVAVGAGMTAGAAAILAMSAFLDVRWDPRASVGMAIAAVWLSQSLVTLHRHRRRRRAGRPSRPARHAAPRPGRHTRRSKGHPR